MAYLRHDICCEVPQLVMSDGWEATCGAIESEKERPRAQTQLVCRLEGCQL